MSKIKAKERLTSDEKINKFIFWKNFRAVMWTLALFVVLLGIFIALGEVKYIIMAKQYNFTHGYGSNIPMTPINSGWLVIVLTIIQYTLIFFPPLLLARMYTYTAENHYKGLGKIRHANFIMLQRELHESWYNTDTLNHDQITMRESRTEEIIDRNTKRLNQTAKGAQK